MELREGWLSFPLRGGSSRGSAQTEVDDSPHFYLDSAADEVLGVGVQTDGDGAYLHRAETSPCSCVCLPTRARARLLCS